MTPRAAHLLCGIAATSYLLAAISCGARSELDLPVPPEPPDTSEGGGPPDCVVFNSSAVLAPLDLFVMLDASGSMSETTPNGILKWQAVRSAFDSFVHDSESIGIGVAVGFFPIVNAGVPQFCFDDMTCGQPDTCQLMNVCSGTQSLCGLSTPCPLGEQCVPLGQCTGITNMQVLCFEPGQECPVGGGPCTPIGFCENRFTCEAEPYGPPVFGIEQLPAAADDFVATIDAKSPDGATPTLPALQGAINNAIAHQNANPTHNVIVVMATDGLPSVCDPALQTDPEQATANLAAAATAGFDVGIQTWVIGVFSEAEEDLARANLDAIASAGGTNEAFIVTTNNVVTESFLEALNQVRLTSKACEFELAQSSEPVDYGEVWVKITPIGGDEIWVKNVDSAAACQSEGSGFFYDVPPGPGSTPTRIILCPQTCSILGASPNRTVEIFTTCPDAPNNSSQ